MTIAVRSRPPEVLEDNILHAIGGMNENARVFNKLLKVSALNREAVSRINTAIDRMVGKWRSIQSTLEPEVTRDMLSKTAQEKLDAAIRRETKRLEAEFEYRVRDEIKRGLAETVLPAWDKEMQEHKSLLEGRKGVFSKVEYNVILRCIHPDTSPDAEQKNAAFRLLHDRRIALLSQEDDPRTCPPLPTLEEILAGRRTRQHAAKAKKTEAA